LLGGNWDLLLASAPGRFQVRDRGLPNQLPV
jgi:hypothetical protein